MSRPLNDSRPTLYLEIDGVLLRRRRGSGMFDAFELARGCVEFLEWATSRFQCRWLSSRCRDGFLDGSRRAFRSAGASLDDPRWGVLDLIPPALWNTSKTEAIDPESDFWWVEDDPTDTERDWLRRHKREDRWILVCADRNPIALWTARSRLMPAVRLRLRTILGRLPKEAQDWIKGMDGGEVSCTEEILNNLGEEAFCRYWRHYKEELDYVRNF